MINSEIWQGQVICYLYLHFLRGTCCLRHSCAKSCSQVFKVMSLKQQNLVASKAFYSHHLHYQQITINYFHPMMLVVRFTKSLFDAVVNLTSYQRHLFFNHLCFTAWLERLAHLKGSGCHFFRHSKLMPRATKNCVTKAGKYFCCGLDLRVSPRKY